MVSSYEKFLKEVVFYIQENKEYRLGQAMMNFLWVEYKNYYNQVYLTEYDCFFDDKIVPAFLIKLSDILYLHDRAAA